MNLKGRGKMIELYKDGDTMAIVTESKDAILRGIK